ncbi:MAG TPA: Mov34/MPN/PAD-1 family protein [Acetobacteraceae bacterium]|nr:Mov34/MPN/PAD-1 family protein [Acetobacteraceae bacterium]
MTAPPTGADGIVWRDQPVASAVRRLVAGEIPLGFPDLEELRHLENVPDPVDLQDVRDRWDGWGRGHRRGRLRNTAGLPVLLRSRACREAIEAHLKEAPIELGGLLVGCAWSLAPENPAEPPVVLCVEAAVPALDAQGTDVSLRMDTELWARAQQAAERRGGIIIGWYHSHPDLGAFFSGTDRRTQAAVFCHAYSLGLVADPIRGEERWFLGPRCREIGPAREFPGRQSSSDQQQEGGTEA